MTLSASPSIRNPNRLANLTNLNTRNGSSKKVCNGSIGVRINPLHQYSRPPGKYYKSRVCRV
jgi:hypothetical protein